MIIPDLMTRVIPAIDDCVYLTAYSEVMVMGWGGLRLELGA